MAYTVLFNTTATHGLPAAINEASSALLRTITGNPAAGISVRNHPMPTLQNEAAVEFSKVAGVDHEHIKILNARPVGDIRHT